MFHGERQGWCGETAETPP